MSPSWESCVASTSVSVMRASPKSRILTVGTGGPLSDIDGDEPVGASSSTTRMFDGLMSRWITPRWCAWATARQIVAKRRSRSRSWAREGRSPPIRSRTYLSSGSPRTSSIVKKESPSSVRPAS